METKKDDAGSSFVLDAQQVIADRTTTQAEGARRPVRTAAGSPQMNLLDELRALDPRDPGRWPLAVRAAAVRSASWRWRSR